MSPGPASVLGSVSGSVDALHNHHPCAAVPHEAVCHMRLQCHMRLHQKYMSPGSASVQGRVLGSEDTPSNCCSAAQGRISST